MYYKAVIYGRKKFCKSGKSSVIFHHLIICVNQCMHSSSSFPLPLLIHQTFSTYGSIATFVCMLVANQRDIGWSKPFLCSQFLGISFSM